MSLAIRYGQLTGPCSCSDPLRIGALGAFSGQNRIKPQLNPRLVRISQPGPAVDGLPFSPFS